jgi:hypothetical protein
MFSTIHMRNGTPAGNASLCQTCRYAHIQQGYAKSEEQVLCGYFDAQILAVRFAVRSCTHYTNKLEKAVWEMEEVATILDVKKITQRYSAGFGLLPTSSKSEAEDDE